MPATLTYTKPKKTVNHYREIQVCDGSLIMALHNFSFTPGDNTLQVFINGVLAQPGTDYDEATLNRVIFVAGRIQTGDTVTFMAQG